MAVILFLTFPGVYFDIDIDIANSELSIYISWNWFHLLFVSFTLHRYYYGSLLIMSLKCYQVELVSSLHYYFENIDLKPDFEWKNHRFGVHEF